MESSMIEQLHFAFIGGGNMAEALLKGLLSGLHIPATQVTATDVVPERLKYLETTYGIKTSMDSLRAAQDHDVIILAIKPQILPEVVASFASEVGRDKLVISIAAGITLQSLQEGVRPGWPGGAGDAQFAGSRVGRSGRDFAWGGGHTARYCPRRTDV